MMYSVRTQDSFFKTFHENETVMQYLILRSTAAEYYKLGHRNLTPHGKAGERTKDLTNKDMVVSIIFINLNIELIDCLASYGTDADVHENGRNWSDEVHEVWMLDMGISVVRHEKDTDLWHSICQRILAISELFVCCRNIR